MRNPIAAIAVILMLAGVAFAHVDRFPSVEIEAPRTVDTTATIKIIAEDDDFRAGVSYIELYEDLVLIERRECSGKLLCRFERTFEHSGEGFHSYRAVAADVTGHKRYATVAVKFLGADRPPTISVVTRAGVDEGSELVVDIEADDVNGDHVVLTVRNMPVGSSFEDGRFVWTPTFSQAGTYVLTLEANTPTKKTTKSLRIHVRDRNREFVVHDKSPRKDTIFIDEDESKRFSVNALDPDGDTLSYRWVLDGRIVSYSPSYIYRPSFNDEGTHQLSVIIKEGYFFRENADGATAERSWTIEVKDKNRDPSINEQRDYTVEEGHRVWFVVKARDPDGDELTIEAFDLPEGSDFNVHTGVFLWQTSVGDRGKYEPRFRVTDSKGLTDAVAVDIRVKKKPVHEIVHEDLHRVGKIATFTESDRDGRFSYGGYSLIG